jgi:hypothetical protein
MMSSSIGGSSSVSSAALAQMRQQRFQALDTDGSGDISESEFAAGPSGSGGMDSGIASALFKSFDTDSSGGLSQDELETGFQKLSSSMRSVLIDAQENGGGPNGAQGGPGGPGGPGGAGGPPPPPPQASSDGSDDSSGGSSTSTSPLDQLISLLEGADGNDSSDTSDSSSSTSAAAQVKSDLKTLLEDLKKLTQSNSVGTQVSV